jgi:hypothetical protein
MRRKRLVLAAAGISVVAGAAFVMVPPFPEPSALISSDYAALQARLGPPTVVFGDKFVQVVVRDATLAPLVRG